MILLQLASGLAGTQEAREARIRAAFVAGFEASISLRTHTRYRSIVPRGPAISHWVVFRAGGIQGSFRVERKSELNRFLLSEGDPVRSHRAGAVVQGFASLAEVRAFCGGAAQPLPPLLQWRNQ